MKSDFREDGHILTKKQQILGLIAAAQHLVKLGRESSELPLLEAAAKRAFDIGLHHALFQATQENPSKTTDMDRSEANCPESLARALQKALRMPIIKTKTDGVIQTHTDRIAKELMDRENEAVAVQLLEPLTEYTPLKRFAEKESLRDYKVSNIKTVPLQMENISLDYGKNFEIKANVVEKEDYILSVTCLANHLNPKGAVADVTFFDKDGSALPKPYSGMSSSKAFGSYFYVETQEVENAKVKNYEFKSPNNATQVLVNIVAFDVNATILLANDYELIPAWEKFTKSFENSNYVEAFEKILSEAKDIPDSNGSEYFTKHDFRVGVIGDVYMYNFYKDVFIEVYYLSPSNYSEVLSQGLDIVIYTTCWKGINNDEWRGIKFREKPKAALDSILSYAKKHGVRTVFQTIEDPSNFEYFLPIAKKFDYVFTTDTDCIERYKKELNHNRVFFGEYGVNPQFNNPIGCRRNTRNAAFFAGSYPERYKERCEDMEIIFDSILDSGGELLIADRNYGTDSRELVYPYRFQSSVLPPVQHDVLQKLHKLFRYNLNFNSIKQSPTMCAMRVYELQAQGNGLISNYANSVFNKFPGVRTIPYKQDMIFDFDRNETWEEYRTNVKNIREVLNSKTSYQVVATLLENIGLSRVEKQKSTIVIICTKKSESVLRSFEKQIYPHKILIEESELKDWKRIDQNNHIGYFCWFGEGNDYEEYYLNDLLNGFKYTNCRYITKNAHFDKKGFYVKGKQHEYTSWCGGKELSLFSTQYLEPAELVQYGIEECFSFDNGYSIDPFEVNFVRYMRANSLQEKKYKLSVIVPVYNNGRFLLTKCIPSLQRNELWEDMEVLLIDDSSTDQETLNTLEYLKGIYKNIKIKFNHGGGSGSASRPRNQGISMASAPLIAFLDPDNEIGPRSYDLLVDLYHEANQASPVPVEFVSGFHVKVGESVKEIGKHTSKRISIIRDFKRGYFKKGKFPLIATQSAVISKKFLDDNNIRFVEGSAGQDTLFGWEVIAKAQCGSFSGDAYILYYADRLDSITNRVNKSYFEKKYTLEKQQVLFLQQHGILQDFLDNHFDNFMKNWYLAKLETVIPEDYHNSIAILSDICKLYGVDSSEYF